MHCGWAAFPVENSADAEPPLLLHSCFGVAIAGQDRAIAAYDRDIEELIAGDGDHAGSCRVLQSVPGIGPVTAAAPVCWTGELGTIGNRLAAALVGVAPMARDSGTMKGARHIRGGRRRPRDVLCMAAMRAKSGAASR